jgi:hypothetical protein
VCFRKEDNMTVSWVGVQMLQERVVRHDHVER